MSLRKEVFLALAVLFSVLLTVDLFTHLLGERKRSIEEMQLHARNAALAIDHLSPQEDPARTMAARMDVWFSSDYFRHMVFRDLQGQVVVQREHPLDDDSVPGWFASLVALPDVIHGTDIHQGEQLVGSLELSIQPTIAYRNLWQLLLEQVAVFGLLVVLSFLVCAKALQYLLRPLGRLEAQATAICDRHFVETQELPRAQELRRVAETMNCMSRRLKTVFDEQLSLTENLRAQSYLDPVTNLSNRRDFNARLQGLSESETGQGGCLMLLQVDDFGRYNFTQGHESGDECLRVIAAHLQTLSATTPDAIVSRRAGADFAIFLPRMDQEQARSLAAQLVGRISELDVLHGHRVHVGVACCDTLKPDHRLLSEADLALRQAQSQTQSGWKMYQEGDVLQVAREARQWYATLNRVLLDRSLILHYQPLFTAEQQQSGFCEVFCRITMHNQVLPAGVFLPMAERFGLSAAFDRLILEDIRQKSDKQPAHTLFCVNLSPQTLANQEFLGWLDGWLSAHPDFSERLVLETAEYLVRTGYQEMSNLCRLLHRHKARLSLDHFGVHSGAFGYLRSLPLDYLKIDRSFIRSIHLDKDNQFYVQSLVQIAHSCGIKVFAEGVELPEEWETVLALGVDGGQGYYLGRPAPELVTSRRAGGEDTVES